MAPVLWRQDPNGSWGLRGKGQKQRGHCSVRPSRRQRICKINVTPIEWEKQAGGDGAGKSICMSGEKRLHSIKQVVKRHVVIWGMENVISNKNLKEQYSPWVSSGWLLMVMSLCCTGFCHPSPRAPGMWLKDCHRGAARKGSSVAEESGIAWYTWTAEFSPEKAEPSCCESLVLTPSHSFYLFVLWELTLIYFNFVLFSWSFCSP